MRGQPPAACEVAAAGATRIVILGGGFAGVYAALALEKTLAKRPGMQVTLVGRENFLLFTPMLHEVASGDLDVTHIVNPIRKMLKRVDFFHGDVASVDLTGRRVTACHGDGHEHVLEYDHLVLALGSVTSWYGIPGLAERAIPMKTLGDAIWLRNHVIECLEAADFECASPEREGLCTLLVAGGGFAGVETAAALHDFLHDAVKSYPHLSPERLRLVLVHAGERLLPELGPELGDYAGRKLAEQGIELRLGVKVVGVDGDAVVLSDGTRVASRTVVWTAGTQPHPLLATLPARKERGRVVVDERLGVEGWPGVWAAGDCAWIPDGKGGAHPPTAQHALREGKVLAGNIAAALDGRPGTPFTFRTLGQLAAIGRRRGVARILGRNFSGFLAWWLWRTIYLAKLPGAEKKLRVMLDWTLDLVFARDLVKLPTSRTLAEEPRPRRPDPIPAAAAPMPLARAGS